MYRLQVPIYLNTFMLAAQKKKKKKQKITRISEASVVPFQSLLHQARATTILIYRLIFPVFKLLVIRILQCVIFCVWLLLFSFILIVVRFIHMVVYNFDLFLFAAV